MKKIYYFLISLIFLTNISACSGYKPIFGSTNLKFKIVDHEIIGDKNWTANVSPVEIFISPEVEVLFCFKSDKKFLKIINKPSFWKISTQKYFSDKK